jgi:Fe-S cluster assembly protein SufD
LGLLVVAMSDLLLPALAELGAADIDGAAQAAGEPAWLVERRRAAWQAYQAAQPPYWSRTDLRRLKLEPLQTTTQPAATTLHSDGLQLEAGVVFLPLAEALNSHGELIEGYLGSAVAPERDKFIALHNALWRDGAFVYVPKNVEVEQPLRVTYRLSEGHAIFPHTLIIVERNARVSVIEEFVGDGDEGQGLCVPVTEGFVADGGELRFATVQQWGDGAYHLGAQKVVLGRDAGIEWTSASLGGRVQHVEAEARMEGNGSRVNWLGVTFANTTQQLLTAPMLRHVGLSTESHMEFKTAVSDTGYSVFDGMIKIELGAQGTSARLEEHALHLSDKSRNDSIPGLEIDANDVKAGHASTSGQIDPEQIFYMQARGLTVAEATRMIVMGFFEPVVEQIPVEEVRERVSAAIEERVR